MYVYFIGLQFSVSGINEIQYFTYATLPGVDPTPLDWKVCSSPDSDVPSEHVIYYQLTTNDESLLDVVKEYCDVDPNVVGLIVVNFTPSNFLPVEILERGIPKRPPICVVSLEDGERIVDFFNTQVNDMDVKVAILAESNVDSGSSGLKSMCTVYVCVLYMSVYCICLCTVYVCVTGCYSYCVCVCVCVCFGAIIKGTLL